MAVAAHVSDLSRTGQSLLTYIKLSSGGLASLLEAGMMSGLSFEDDPFQIAHCEEDGFAYSEAMEPLFAVRM